jgi:cytidylate kinase
MVLAGDSNKSATTGRQNIANHSSTLSGEHSPAGVCLRQHTEERKMDLTQLSDAEMHRLLHETQTEMACCTRRDRMNVLEARMRILRQLMQ